VSIDEQHIALPKLYGAPAYARPAMPVETTPRPFDPDDLPIEAAQTEEERAFAADLPARSWAPGGGPSISMDGYSATSSHGHGSGNGHAPTGTGIKPRSFKLKSIAGKLLGE
jgi:hypothetical protein